MFDYIEESATYDAAIAKLQNLYTKPPNEVFARHLLAITKQQSGQTLDKFLFSLQKLARDCNFRAVSGDQYKKEMIRDVFINGLVSHGIRQRLLENRELGLENAVEKARAMELAQKNSEFYSNIPESRNNLAAASGITNLYNDDDVSKDSLCPSMSVNKQETASSVSKICSFCGRPYHLRSLCPARNATCYKCQKKEHFANVCKSKPTKNTNASMSNSVLCVIHKTPDCLARASLVAQIADTELSALIDTSSSMSFINGNTAKRLNIAISLCFDNISMAFSSFTENVRGCCNVDVHINGNLYRNVNLKVLKNLCSDALSGQDFQSMHKHVIFQYEGEKDDFVVSKTSFALTPASTQFPSLFQNLSKNCKPIAVKSRRFNADDQLFIGQEIDRLRSEGIIKPSISLWRAQIVVVKDTENNKHRMCIDYSQTVNLFTELDTYPLPKIEFLVNELAKYCVFSTFDRRSAYHQILIAEKDRPFTALEACGTL